MQKIRPHLWYDTQAEEAAEHYASIFPDSRVTNVTTIYDTPSGDCPIVSFELWGLEFQAISAGPLFKFNPSISLLVLCDDEEQVDTLWAKLTAGGTTLMPLDSYPHSKRYGWIADRYGLTWQLMLANEYITQRITPTLMFTGRGAGMAEEAIKLYTSALPGSKIGDAMRYGKDEGPDREGTMKFAGFQLAGQEFGAMDSAREHEFDFNEAVSLMVSCDTQKEIDTYWSALSAVPESEQCGWLKDRFGVSWQIVPAAMDEMMRNGGREQIDRVTQSFLKMKKFDLAELRRAYES